MLILVWILLHKANFIDLTFENALYSLALNYLWWNQIESLKSSKQLLRWWSIFNLLLYRQCQTWELLNSNIAQINSKYLKQNIQIGGLFWLTQFTVVLSFYTPWKHQKISGFLMFSGGIENDQWHEMGQCQHNYFANTRRELRK